MVTFETDNLIYNRFDLIYKDKNIERFLYEVDNETFAIDAHYKGNRASLNIWGKLFPQRVFNQVVYDIFERHLEIDFLDIRKSGNRFGDILESQSDIRVQLPETWEQLFSRVKAKNRSTIIRKKKNLRQQYGDLKLEVYHEEVPEEAVKQYFFWKKKSHGTDYHMSPRDYIQKYFVTDTLFLKAGETDASILFICQVEKTAYLENLAYNCKLSKFSPGFLLYGMALEELIKRGCSYLYLGGGDYGYKTRFGGEVSTVYTGVIQRKDIV